MTLEYQGRWPTPEELQPTAFPSMILLNLTNICNLSCPKCPLPQMRQEPDYHPQMMALDLYQKIIDEISLHPGTVVKLLGDGEPLIVPWITDMVQYAKAKAMKPIGLITSGLNLTESKSQKLLKAGIDYIDFSLDALSKSTYEKVRVGSNFERVMNNVGRFLQLRHEIQPSHPPTKVLVNIIDQPEAQDEIPAFKAYWEPKVDRVYVRPLHSVAGLVPIKLRETPQDRWPCRVLWERLDINPNGDILHCSISWDRPNSIVGNAHNQTLASVWQGDRMRALRQSHQNQQLPPNSLCFDCEDWQVFRWGDSSQKYLLDLTQKG